MGHDFMKYELKPFDDKWKICFSIEKKKLEEKLKGFDVASIEHIGATSVILCGTLGTIDIVVSLNSIVEVTTVKNYLCKNGYEAIEKGCGNSQAFLVRRNDKNEIVATIRVVPNCSKQYIKLIAFKYYLRQNKNNALKYNEFRQALLETCGNNLAKYKEVKANYINSILEEHCKFE